MFFLALIPSGSLQNRGKLLVNSIFFFQVMTLIKHIDPRSFLLASIGDIVCSPGSVIATANITLQETVDASQVRKQIEEAFRNDQIENLDSTLIGVSTASVETDSK